MKRMEWCDVLFVIRSFDYLSRCDHNNIVVRNAIGRHTAWTLHEIIAREMNLTVW